MLGVYKFSVERDYIQKTCLREYWIVDPLKNIVTVCLLEKGSYPQIVFIENQQIISTLFPALTFTVQQTLST
ncbi:Uma2 family endonuclease [Trichormus variabilis ARAD]|uniref:Uma2 family endonuclease n=1 Tax=Trichormus variabilis N2B TaxID=2681315 RepID=A0ABR6S4Z9_ANAVA|nr:Uma2 family endonuclease [Trichormus variabilis ARAD]MBC1254813.1 Uma2 family endonuclease [Trichormus variabilis V5]MBC1266147.1 Uma2 family endonuclease [Trichormus variabilis FSR]MBC1301453.1 Uma2 family endonuclease [Trichormus variabilis N2B]MBC1312477.1 Uma2 family endonuclease [Trichormus variabilis PNB]MBC1325434.1 Uma2 family endonuclease [Trichormus variabilis 9RC]MBD2381182.1 Uma2 family endonuclease [Trichormus variabilis FACHB-319]QFZ15828.1 Uma2 family endonuclease [Anabaena